MRIRVATSPARQSRGPARRAVGLLVALGVLAFVATMSTVIVTIAIWPGEAKLTAPILCPENAPDAFVVADHTSSGAGETSTNFTMYCMGPRGETEDIGFARPFVVLTLAHGLGLIVLLSLVVLLGVLAAARARPPASESTEVSDPTADDRGYTTYEPPRHPQQE